MQAKFYLLTSDSAIVGDLQMAFTHWQALHNPVTAKELKTPPVKESMASPLDFCSAQQYCAAVPPVCKSDPAGLGAGTMSVKTTSQGVLPYENWT